MRRMTSLGSKHMGKSVRAATEELQGERCGGYLSVAPTAHYVAVVRPDLQYTMSVLMRTLETPLKQHQMQLKRGARVAQGL